MRSWLVDIRIASGKSQQTVADEAGISQSYYAGIESGTRGNPLSVSVAKKISNALGFSWTLFYEDAQDAERPSA